MMKELYPKISIRLFREEKCFGPGIAELLKHVRELHSLRSAASTMNMAYSKAWRIVKASENALGFKLLRSVAGGVHGGGAELTREAEQLLGAYDQFRNTMEAMAARLFEENFLPILKK